eukprot:92036-Prymnesium_polylepis.1
MQPRTCHGEMGRSGRQIASSTRSGAGIRTSGRRSRPRSVLVAQRYHAEVSSRRQTNRAHTGRIG